MRVFYSWAEVRKAYGWIGSEPIARRVIHAFDHQQPIVIVPTEADAERKVIEAARALLVDDRPLQQRVDRIVSAVKALEAEEK